MKNPTAPLETSMANFHECEWRERAEKAEAQLVQKQHAIDALVKNTIKLSGDIEKLEGQLAAMIEGLELQGDAITASPEALKITCQIVALAAKKYDPMKAQLAEVKKLPEKWSRRPDHYWVGKKDEHCASDIKAILEKGDE